MSIDCSNCKGECCGVFPIPKELASRTQEFAQVKPTEVFDFEDKVIVMTQDGKCIYLNRETYRCAIYGKRPEICRRYGIDERLPCPYFSSDGRRRTLSEKKLIDAKISITVDNALRLAEQKIK